MDDYAQPDAPDEFGSQEATTPPPNATTPPPNKWRKRSTKGNVKAQRARWRARKATHHRDYMRRYMAHVRAAQRNPNR